MLYALKDEKRLRPTATGERAQCPRCSREALSKCGRLVTWHWAHMSKRDCDPWAAPETEWHREWKLHFPAEKIEVDLGAHRADAVTTSGCVIEFQHSSLPVSQIQEREAFYWSYGGMVWVIDARRWKHNFEICFPECERPVWTYANPSDASADRDEALLRTLSWPPGYENARWHHLHRKGYRMFKWLWRPQSWLAARCPMFLDFGEHTLLRIREVDGFMKYIWGRKLLKREFIRRAVSPAHL